jgi:hypothetical protein
VTPKALSGRPGKKKQQRVGRAELDMPDFFRPEANLSFTGLGIDHRKLTILGTADSDRKF